MQLIMLPIKIKIQYLITRSDEKLHMYNCNKTLINNMSVNVTILCAIYVCFYLMILKYKTKTNTKK